MAHSGIPRYSHPNGLSSRSGKNKGGRFNLLATATYDPLIGRSDYGLVESFHVSTLFLFTLEVQADSLKAEAEAIKGAARLEDLSVWVMEKAKTTKKGKTTYSYWMASWREGDKVRNVHLGSCSKVDREAAMQKASKMKAEALGLSAQS